MSQVSINETANQKRMLEEKAAEKKIAAKKAIEEIINPVTTVINSDQKYYRRKMLSCPLKGKCDAIFLLNGFL